MFEIYKIVRILTVYEMLSVFGKISDVFDSLEMLKRCMRGRSIISSTKNINVIFPECKIQDKSF